MVALPAAIAFHSAAHGLLGTTRSIEATRDGGRTWRVVFKAPRPVMWVGYDVSGRQRAILDDGENLGGPRWRPEAPVELLTPCPAGVNASVHSDDWVLCIGQGSAGAGAKAVFRATRAGPRRCAPLPRFGYAVGIGMAHDGFGIVWESRGTLYVTRDACRHWTPLPKVAVPETDFGISGAAVRGGVAWVLLARGNIHRRLLRTDDFGRTWRAIHRWR